MGLVGNTGNARSTPPHLHFGAYRRGARDPWDLILPAPPRIPDVGVDTDVVGSEGLVEGGGVRLRQSPSTRGAVLTDFAGPSPVRPRQPQQEVPEDGGDRQPGNGQNGKSAGMPRGRKGSRVADQSLSSATRMPSASA